MGTMRALLWAGLLACSLPAAADKPVAPVEIAGAVNVTAEKLVDLFATTPQLVMIDSRRQEEFEKGHIEGAFNLLDADMTQTSLAKLVAEKYTPVLFYCNGERCLRSSNAAKLALEWGYHKVYWFRGGWKEWSDKSLPVAK
ncbi:MAG: rhodanese-like domain-containing protein [Gammaproteobacteria bacterium]|nr:rhodanese-like domain-containing protein [Gammaproteobacteria bacterium]MBU1730747.1 rhodanese-like domain-containing protein [Gammaproteobacteria bacterium]MBU1891293.1 rhodanese-like domain-containing protein [Gammaproteobacteria bacterium]